MSKIFKFIGRFIGIAFEWILILFVAFAFFIRTSEFQTFLAKQLASYLSKELNTTIKIDKVAIVFFDRVALDGVLILDQKADTLLSVSTVYANFDEINLYENSYRIGKAELEKGVSHISKDKQNGVFNFQFLADYFKSDQPKPESVPLKLSVDAIGLNDVALKYDDYAFTPKPFGIDYSHLQLKRVKVELSNFNFGKEQIGLHIQNLNAEEKCGLKIQKWTSDILFSPKGLKLDNLSIQTPLSRITIKKFHLLTNDLNAYKSFNDSVSFDVDILKSTVSTTDIAYFVPAIEGMSQTFSIQTKIKSSVNKLILEKFEFQTGKKTQIKGTFNLPDFNNLKSSKRKQNIELAYIDLDDIQNIKLPKSSTKRYLSLDKNTLSNLYFKLQNFVFDGTTSNFNLKFDRAQTANGTLNLKNGIQVSSKDNFKSFEFHPVSQQKPMLVAEKLNLKALTGSTELGFFDGQIRLDGEINGAQKVKLDNINASINRLDLSNYSYSSISITNTSFINQILTGFVKINDPNLKANFEGIIDLGEKKKANCELDILQANLEPLRLNKTAGRPRACT